MKAIVVKEFGAPDVMKLEEVPDPVPGPGQLLIRVGAVGVNPVEAYIRAGTYARKPNLPYIPGSDVGGTVENSPDGPLSPPSYIAVTTKNDPPGATDEPTEVCVGGVDVKKFAGVGCTPGVLER